MEIGEIISYALAALGGGGLSGVVYWRLNKRQKKAEVKGDEIENLNAIVEKVYKPMIDSLKERVDELDTEVRKLREERELIAKEHESEIKAIKEDWADFITTSSTTGAQTSTPPSGAGKTYKTKEEIFAIKDTAERQKAIYDNKELFGIT